MPKESIINLLDSSNIANDMKEAYTFMLLSRGYSVDDIKILDDYVFLLKKKDFGENGESATDQGTIFLLFYLEIKTESVPVTTQKTIAYIPTKEEPELMYKLFDGIACTLEELIDMLNY